MTIQTDPRSFLYHPGQLDIDEAQRLTATALARADDGELYLQYRRSEAFGFDDGRLKTASYDTQSGFGLRAVAGEMTAFAHANELSAAAIARAAETMALIDPTTAPRAAPPRATNRHLYTDADPLDLVPFADKVALCQRIDAAARARDPRVAQVSVSLSGSWSVVEVVRPDGFVATDIRPLVAAERLDRRGAEWPPRNGQLRAWRALSLRPADGSPRSGTARSTRHWRRRSSISTRSTRRRAR